MHLDFELCDRQQNVLTRLDSRRGGGRVELGLNTARRAFCPLSLEDPAFAVAEAIKTVLRVTLKGPDDFSLPLFIGRVLIPDQRSSEEGEELGIHAIDPRFQLDRALVRTEGVGTWEPVIFAATDQSQIMWALIAAADDHGVIEGDLPVSTNRDRTYAPGKEVGFALQEMSEVIGGPDFEFEPAVASDGTLARFNTFYTRQGSDKSADVVFVHGATPFTASGFSYAPGGESIVNRCLAIGAAQDSEGGGTPFALHPAYVAEHADSIAEHGVFEQRISLDDVIETATLQSYAEGIVATGAYPVPFFDFIATPEQVTNTYPRQGTEFSRLLAAALDLDPLYGLAPGTASDPLTNLGSVAGIPDAVLKGDARLVDDLLLPGGAAVSLDGTGDFVDTGCPNEGGPGGRVGWWKFDGDVLDSSGSGNNGTAYGALRLIADRSGNADSAYHFNGTDTYVSVPESASLSDWAELSICFWFNMSEPQPAYARIIEKGSNNEITIVSNYNGDGQIAIQHLGQATLLFRSPGSYIDDAWHHATFTISSSDPSVIRLYIDATEVISGESAQPSNKAHFSTIGRYGTGGFHYKGGLDDIRIYNTVLTPDEVQAVCIGPPRSYVTPIQRANTGAVHTILGSSDSVVKVQASLGSNDVTATFNSGTNTVTWADALPDLDQALVILQLSGTSTTLNIDGVDQGTRTVVRAAVTGSLLLGAHGAGSDPWDGLILPFFTFDRALT